MSILKRLEDGNILGIVGNGDGGFNVYEGCDCYYHTDLTVSEMMQLSREIMDMAVGRKEPAPIDHHPV